jgi:hypothetical protein
MNFQQINKYFVAQVLATTSFRGKYFFEDSKYELLQDTFYNSLTKTEQNNFIYILSKLKYHYVLSIYRDMLFNNEYENFKIKYNLN